jgi:hypothetical protein
MRTKSIAVLVVVLAWSLSLTTPAVLKHFGMRIATGPTLPFVLSTGAKGCVRSSRLHLLLLLSVAGVGISFAEAAKIVLRSPAVIVSVAVFQVVLLFDCIRAYAWDWWTYIYVTGTGGVIDSLTAMSPIAVSGVTWPWISGVAGVLAIAVVITRRVAAPSNKRLQST